jgi:hypothetical protein
MDHGLGYKPKLGFRFIEKETGQPAKCGRDGREFFIDKDGNVIEYIDQYYCGYHTHTIRADLKWEWVLTWIYAPEG